MDGKAAPLHWLDDVVRQVPLLAGLEPGQVEALCRTARRRRVKPGEVVIEEGTEGDSLIVILSGALEITKHEVDREVVLATRTAGDYLGEVALLTRAPRSASARAVEETEVLVITAEAFRALLETRPSTATTILTTMARRLRSTEASLVQADRLAALGTLAAGLAHELNNPAAAIQRSSTLIGETIEQLPDRAAALRALDLTEAERQELTWLERTAGERRPASASEEQALTDRLEALGVAQAWDLGPTLAAAGWTSERLAGLEAGFARGHIGPVLQWLGSLLAARQLAGEINHAARAISEIVRAVKSYARLDEGPVQDVDLPASLEDTLIILRHKLKHGVEVVRAFEPDLPLVEAHGGELNQVWTNIIDNAVDAMAGRGRLELAARRLGEAVEVRIVDDGPGIPPDVLPRIFDPFFTTKPQGKGTGLGLHIAQNIVVNRHRGRLDVDSRPGRTEFRVMLPVRLDGGQRPEHQKQAPVARPNS